MTVEVDPDARIADLARRNGVEVEVATIEAWDQAGRAFDAVVAGQAWHWVDPVAGAAKAAQALRPGGQLAVFWNAFQPPPGVGEAFAAAYRRVLPDSPVFRQFPPARQQELLADIGAAVDAVGGGFTMRYATLAVAAARTGTF